MDSFEYLSVLISVIVGLAITQILQGVRALMLVRSRIRLYLPPLIWAGLLLLVAAQMWWSMFGLRDETDWTFALYGILLLQTTLLYLASGLILPDVDPTDVVDLEASYHANARWFFAVLTATALVSVWKELAVEGRLPEGPNLVFHIILIGISIAAAVTRARWFHILLAPVMAAGFVAYIALLFARLGE